jgi:hypothetical protein
VSVRTQFDFGKIDFGAIEPSPIGQDGGGTGGLAESR